MYYGSGIVDSLASKSKERPPAQKRGDRHALRSSPSDKLLRSAQNGTDLGRLGPSGDAPLASPQDRKNRASQGSDSSSVLPTAQAAAANPQPAAEKRGSNGAWAKLGEAQQHGGMDRGMTGDVPSMFGTRSHRRSDGLSKATFDPGSADGTNTRQRLFSNARAGQTDTSSSAAGPRVNPSGDNGSPRLPSARNRGDVAKVAPSPIGGTGSAAQQAGGEGEGEGGSPPRRPSHESLSRGGHLVRSDVHLGDGSMGQGGTSATAAFSSPRVEQRRPPRLGKGMREVTSNSQIDKNSESAGGIIGGIMRTI